MRENFWSNAAEKVPGRFINLLFCQIAVLPTNIFSLSYVG